MIFKTGAPDTGEALGALTVGSLFSGIGGPSGCRNQYLPLGAPCLTATRAVMRESKRQKGAQGHEMVKVMAIAAANRKGF